MDWDLVEPRLGTETFEVDPIPRFGTISLLWPGALGRDVRLRAGGHRPAINPTEMAGR